MDTSYRGWDVEYDAPWHCAYRGGKSLCARSRDALRSMIDMKELSYE